MAVPPQTLNDQATRENPTRTIWATVPAPVKGELLEALKAMLAAVALPGEQEECHE